MFARDTRSWFCLLLVAVLAACDGGSGGGVGDAAVADARAADGNQPADATVSADAFSADAFEADAGPADASPTTIAFTPVAGFVMPEGIATSRELVLFESEAEFVAYFGVASPASLDLSTQWALLYTEGALSISGHIATVTSLAVDPSGDTLYTGTHLRSPGNACEVLGYTQAAFALVSFEALSGTVANLAAIDNAHASSAVDCAAEGGGDSASCDLDSLCGAGLICGGLSRFSPGICYPTSFWGTFADDRVSPISDLGTLLRQLDVSGLATVDMDVVVYVEVDHPAPSELRITITNPSNNEVTVWDHEAATGPVILHRAPIGFSGDESVNGTWTLTVYDTVADKQGSITGWHVEIVSRLD